ncbi:hypothetical protein ONZ45_g5839 [Pleurotus djamor]|nr:hypothetical protein ONZ45_g5839 [Pleurotus djamor]
MSLSNVFFDRSFDRFVTVNVNVNLSVCRIPVPGRSTAGALGVNFDYDYGSESRPQSRRLSVMELCNDGSASSSATAASGIGLENGGGAGTGLGTFLLGLGGGSPRPTTSSGGVASGVSAMVLQDLSSGSGSRSDSESVKIPAGGGGLQNGNRRAPPPELMLSRSLSTSSASSAGSSVLPMGPGGAIRRVASGVGMAGARASPVTASSIHSPMLQQQQQHQQATQRGGPPSGGFGYGFEGPGGMPSPAGSVISISSSNSMGGGGGYEASYTHHRRASGLLPIDATSSSSPLPFDHPGASPSPFMHPAAAAAAASARNTPTPVHFANQQHPSNARMYTGPGGSRAASRASGGGPMSLGLVGVGVGPGVAGGGGGGFHPPSSPFYDQSPGGNVVLDSSPTSFEFTAGGAGSSGAAGYGVGGVSGGRDMIPSSWCRPKQLTWGVQGMIDVGLLTWSSTVGVHTMSFLDGYGGGSGGGGGSTDLHGDVSTVVAHIMSFLDGHGGGGGSTDLHRDVSTVVAHIMSVQEGHDKPTVSSALRETYPEYYGDNIWPDPGLKGIEGFEEAFKDLGRFVFKVGVEMAAACQPFGVFPLSPSTFMVKAPLTPLSFVASNIYSKALSHLSDQSVSLPALIFSSQTNKARLLHYFPPTANVDEEGEEDEPIDNWCGMHCDHSLLTGLCSAMYLRQDSNGEVATIPPPSPSSGLYIKTRGGDLTKVTIPPDCLAFQTGESLQLATGGRLRATPHCVRAGLASDDLDLEAGRVSRETFAVFMGPDVDQRLTETLTFGEFSKQVFNEHYN